MYAVTWHQHALHDEHYYFEAVFEAVFDYNIARYSCYHITYLFYHQVEHSFDYHTHTLSKAHIQHHTYPLSKDHIQHHE